MGFFILGFFLLFCIMVVIYPYFVYPMILKLLPEKPIYFSQNKDVSFTLVWCAYNEGEVMKKKLENVEMLKRHCPDLEVLAFDDGSSDNTYEQMVSRPDLLTVIRGGGRSGKANGMKRLAKLATGDVLIFTDANVMLAADSIEKLSPYYADQEVGGVCGSLEYLGEENSTTASVGGWYWRLEERIKGLESITGNVMGADGSVFSLRRSLYPSFPDTVLDDLTVSMAAVFAKKRLVIADDVFGYENLVVGRGEEFSRKIRIAARAFHTHLYLKPQLKKMSLLDKFKYFSRKFIRWFGGLFLVLGFLIGVLLAYLIHPLLALVSVILLGAGVGVGITTKSGIVAVITEITLALIATLFGVLKAIRGETVVTWSPAKSRNKR